MLRHQYHEIAWSIFMLRIELPLGKPFIFIINRSWITPKVRIAGSGPMKS
jgi:hypothetical protein